MMHSKIADEDIIERYVRNRLDPEERKAFEQHYFACDECFEKVQVAERFVAGMRDVALRGKLKSETEGGVHAWPMASWWIPALGVSASLAVILAVMSGWLYLVQMPRMREQLGHSAAELRQARQARAALEEQLVRSSQPESNVPLVILQATRDLRTPVAELVLPAEAAHLVLWIDVGSGRYSTYDLEIDSPEGKPVATVQHLTRNSYGALAATLPAERLQSGEFRIKLFGEKPPPASLLAEYSLRISRP
jgi:hypothetical protein